MSRGSGTSSEQACLHTWEYCRVSKRILSASMSTAIAFKVRTASCNKTACVNSFGDEQLAVDMLADKILFETLQYSQVCEQACSEEVPEPLDMG